MLTQMRCDVLLVDNEPANLLALQASLSGLDAGLICATSGESALKHLLTQDFALILLDVNMPTMSGFELARLIRDRERSRTTPIIFLTAYDNDALTIDEAYDAGAVDYLTKPINTKVLRSKVNVFLELYRKTAQVAWLEQETLRTAYEEKDQKLRLIMANTRDYAFISLDQNGIISKWEGGAELITGWNASDAIGHHIGMIFTAEDIEERRPETELSIAKEDGRAINKRWHVRKDGTRFFADGVMLALRDSSNELLGFSNIFRDATVDKRADENLRLLANQLSEADRRKTEFLATLAHELRNPLAPIRNGMAVLGMSLNNPNLVTKILAMMDRQLSQMVRLIDDLLDVARITAGKLELKKELVDLADVIATAVEMSSPTIEGNKHELKIDLPQAPIYAEIDKTRICQVIANLLNNAAKYTAPGGKILLALSDSGNEFKISVLDNGIGISSNALPHVFDMFNQVDERSSGAKQGLGIGLSLVRRLVEMHDGSVSVASEGENMGSIFSVVLPCYSGNISSSKSPSNLSIKSEASSVLNVLVVDDNTDAAETLSMILEMSGHDCHVASDGNQGIALAGKIYPDIAFLDIGMPGLNGYEVATAIRKIPGLLNICLVAVTGWGTADDRNRSSEAGFDYHLTKPADISEVERIVIEISRLKISTTMA
jgi:PAS domain S-box-containing protein